VAWLLPIENPKNRGSDAPKLVVAKRMKIYDYPNERVKVLIFSLETS
jgi:hypothetical protein